MRGHRWYYIVRVYGQNQQLHNHVGEILMNRIARLVDLLELGTQTLHSIQNRLGQK